MHSEYHRDRPPRFKAELLHAEEHWSQYLVNTKDVSERNESERALPGLLQDLESHAWRQSQL